MRVKSVSITRSATWLKENKNKIEEIQKKRLKQKTKTKLKVKMIKK